MMYFIVIDTLLELIEFYFGKRMSTVFFVHKDIKGSTRGGYLKKSDFQYL